MFGKVAECIVFALPFICLHDTLGGAGGWRSEQNIDGDRVGKFMFELRAGGHGLKQVRECDHMKSNMRVSTTMLCAQGDGQEVELLLPGTMVVNGCALLVHARIMDHVFDRKSHYNQQAGRTHRYPRKSRQPWWSTILHSAC